MGRKIKKVKMRLKKSQLKVIRKKTEHQRKKRRKMNPKKIKRKKRKRILNLCSILLMEDLQSCIHCGRMRRRLQFQAGNTRSGIDAMTTGCCQESCATGTVGGRIFRMIRGSQLSMNHLRWTLGKGTSWRSRISSLPGGSSYWSK